MSIYSNPNWFEREKIAIERLIRASNAEQMARRRTRDDAQRLIALEVPSALRLRAVASLSVREFR